MIVIKSKRDLQNNIRNNWCHTNIASHFKPWAKSRKFRVFLMLIMINRFFNELINAKNLIVYFDQLIYSSLHLQ